MDCVQSLHVVLRRFSGSSHRPLLTVSISASLDGCVCVPARGCGLVPVQGVCQEEEEKKPSVQHKHRRDVDALMFKTAELPPLIK